MRPLTLCAPNKRRPNQWSSTTVRLTDDARRCVVFLGHASPSGGPDDFQPVATGFFLTEMTAEARATYLVTAKHCVVKGLNEPFHIRFNQPNGSFVLLIENPEWHFHDDPTVDVAIMEFEPPRESENIRFANNRVVDARLFPEHYSAGDLTYTVGLFSFHRGASKNIPLVHTGHIAALPEERVKVRDWDSKNRADRKHIEAFVVQCQAMPGASGSPVFVRKSVTTPHFHEHLPWDSKPPITTTNLPPNAYGEVYLLGLWHGAWELDADDMIGMTSIRNPAGYGIVVPAYKIQETFDMPKPKGDREDRLKERRAKKAESLPAST